MRSTQHDPLPDPLPLGWRVSIGWMSTAYESRTPTPDRLDDSFMATSDVRFDPQWLSGHVGEEFFVLLVEDRPAALTHRRKRRTGQHEFTYRVPVAAFLPDGPDERGMVRGMYVFAARTPAWPDPPPMPVYVEEAVVRSA